MRAHKVLEHSGSAGSVLAVEQQFRRYLYSAVGFEEVPWLWCGPQACPFWSVGQEMRRLRQDG